MCCAYILYCNYFIQANLYKKFVFFFSIEKDYHVINTLMYCPRRWIYTRTLEAVPSPSEIEKVVSVCSR